MNSFALGDSGDKRKNPMYVHSLKTSNYNYSPYNHTVKVAYYLTISHSDIIRPDKHSFALES